MLNTKLVDGKGSKQTVKVNGDNALYVTEIPHPPFTPQLQEPFRQYFTDDGLSSGSNDLAVDGSSTNVDFWIPSSTTSDRYISSLSFIVGYGTTGQPNEWCDGTALTNGIRVFYTSSRGEIDIHEGIQSNQDMFRLKNLNVDLNWEVRHVNANNDFGYFIVADLKILFGFKFGIKLDKGTNEKLIIRIRDNMTTNTDSFNCIAYGFDRFER